MRHRRLPLLSVLLALSLSAASARAATLHFAGTFGPNASPGSAAPFVALQNGRYEGAYTVPDGSLPGASGTSIGLSSFNVRASAPNGDVVFDFLSGRDFGALYFDFFGPGTGDGFVFINALRGAVHLQVAVPTGFTGTGPIGSAAIFGGVGGPVGQIDGKSGVAYVPLPAPAVLLAAAITALGFVAARRRASPRGMRAA